MFNLKEKVLNHKNKDSGLTYGEMLSEVMFMLDNADSPSNKYRYFSLGSKFFEQEEIELDNETIDFVMEKVLRVGSNLTVGRTKQFLVKSE